MDKIDILKFENVIIYQNLTANTQTYYTISELNGERLNSYTGFTFLVDSKLSKTYSQTYVSKEPVIRFVGLTVDSYNFNNIEEVLYENLTNDEKIIYDNFYNNFKT